MTEDKKTPLFYCGAQMTSDDDMLPASFTVFDNNVDQDDAVGVIVQKIAQEIQELDMDEAQGLLAFVKINSWQDWAELKLSEEVKMSALAEAIVGLHSHVIEHSNRMSASIALGLWTLKP